MLKILSVPFAENNMTEAVCWTNERMEKALPTFIVTANPEIVMKARKDSSFYEVISAADMITPDGIGIIYASKILGYSLKERVGGYDMIHALLEHREHTGAATKLFLLGSTEDVVAAAGEKLTELYGHAQVMGTHHGYFEKDSDEERLIVERISREKPDLLLVGAGNPKQEEFIHRFKNELGATVMIGVGGSFDILSGRICRAPELFRKLGLEWFYRLLCEPKRIKRQMVLPVFALQVFVERVRRGSGAVEVKSTKTRV
ncbi:WecB/TagA/CpsF family glycosyltransferase [Domibacillus sp. DTU_2020_1001157_1_SI_ALB_TIR_016]|uniref:WecB/TagA/CpsF family glycosyltransferase n=1 Tax=Domibacillus sp. DTU_2020_1001157_1_SI_ALB_TIR_016 TaxID=3077789 RepID=UPI0028F130A8|nr:WecB/TagA/CpsF family glycosyltransferase [Domibacillus sp. DTU_2020_1001157_1_SI_ALB_TIR_016]WNS78288.1 WecB/TagA/CpsF family glycosyltransferase [Domibacillus sp. DTU_2020_1001157_1_SI_ALB_TIR_016]